MPTGGMNIVLRAMLADDYASVVALWHRTEGIGLGESDTEQAITAYLSRNPGMSAVADLPDGNVIGAVLCGHDGRRGYLHHLAVAREYRRMGVAGRLLDWSYARLHEEGIAKCSVFMFTDNQVGAAFWTQSGWSSRPDLRVFQKVLSSRG